MKRLLAVVSFLLALCVAPAQAQYVGNGVVPNSLCSATANLPIGCAPTLGDQVPSFYAAPTNTLTQFVAAPPAGQSIRITFVAFTYLDSATGGALLIKGGTGTNCASNTYTAAVGPWDVATSAVQGSWGTGYGQVIILKAGYAACASLAGTITLAAINGTFAVW